MQGFTHFDENGAAVMVDVSDKEATQRVATAMGTIQVSAAVMEAVLGGTVKKGDVLGIARVAGIMAAKRTSELIPLCHILLLSNCQIEFETDAVQGRITAYCTVKTEGKTGVEMEAIVGVQIALTTIYDMCKAIDKEMVISNVCLLEKQGGKSGHFTRSLRT